MTPILLSYSFAVPTFFVGVLRILKRPTALFHNVDIVRIDIKSHHSVYRCYLCGLHYPKLAAVGLELYSVCHGFAVFGKRCEVRVERVVLVCEKTLSAFCLNTAGYLCKPACKNIAFALFGNRKLAVNAVFAVHIVKAVIGFGRFKINLIFCTILINRRFDDLACALAVSGPVRIELVGHIFIDSAARFDLVSANGLCIPAFKLKIAVCGHGKLAICAVFGDLHCFSGNLTGTKRYFHLIMNALESNVNYLTADNILARLSELDILGTDNNVNIFVLVKAFINAFMFSAAERNGMQIIAVTLQDAFPTSTHKTLLDNAFSNHEAVRLADIGEIRSDIPISNGESKFLNITNTESAEILLPKNSNVTCELFLPKVLYAPIEKGTVIGYAIFRADGSDVYIITLEATESIEEKKKTLSEKLFGE